VRFTFDARQPSGARLVGPLTRDDGREIRDDEVLQVSFPSYPSCRGGDGYEIPEAREACAAFEAEPTSAPRSAALVVSHVERMNGRVVAPPTGRVRRLDRPAR
jgi:hypothetical protein